MSSDDEEIPAHEQTFGQRHALTIMLAIMAALLALVIVVQVS